MKILILGDPFKVDINSCNSVLRQNHEFYMVPSNIGPPNICHLRDRLQKEDTKETKEDNYLFNFIHSSKPDLVIIICEGCTERFINEIELPKGPKYVTWTTDSYRHTVRVNNPKVNLHLSSIPDATLTKEDIFLPLFASRQNPIPLDFRNIELGIICRSYNLDDNWRENQIEKLKSIYGFYRGQNLTQFEYNTMIRNFKFGLNLGIWRDGLPNFRSFELGMNGIMPVCDNTNESILREQFDTHILIFNDIYSVPDLIRNCNYDPEQMANWYCIKHSFISRMNKILEMI